MSASLAPRAFDRYERHMSRCGAILSMCLLGGCSSQHTQEVQAPEVPPSGVQGAASEPLAPKSSSGSRVSLPPSEPARLHFPHASFKSSSRIGFELVPLPGQGAARVEFEAAIGEPLLLPEAPAGEYRLQPVDPELWMETTWISVQGSEAPDIGDVFVYPVSAPCYWGARLGQDCFVFDATRAEVMRVGYRSSSGFRVWADVQTREDPGALQRIEHVHFRDMAEGPSAKGGEILVGPGTMQIWVEQALTWAQQMHLPVAVAREPEPPNVDSRALRVVPKLPLGRHQARLFSLLPELGGCFTRHQVEQEIHVDVRFEGGIPHEVALSSGLPAPPVPSCSEYDEDMGRCSREPPPHPDSLLNRAWLSCLKGELRALRGEGDEAWSFLLRPEVSGESVGKAREE